MTEKQRLLAEISPKIKKMVIKEIHKQGLVTDSTLSVDQE